MRIVGKAKSKDQKEIAVLNAPTSFTTELKALKRVRVHRHISGVKELTFVLTFVVTKIELEKVAEMVVSHVSGEALVWFAYPKGTSTTYKCDFNRDKGWDVLRKSGFGTVRQVAIDEDWSALRFRRVEFINHRAGKLPPLTTTIGPDSAAMVIMAARTRCKAKKTCGIARRNKHCDDKYCGLPAEARTAEGADKRDKSERRAIALDEHKIRNARQAKN